MFNIYEQLNSLEDVGVIAGSYTTLTFDWCNSDGSPILLSEADSYGCTFSMYGNEDVSLFTIDGNADNTSALGNRMILEVYGDYTEGFPDCVLTYCPYLVMGAKVLRPAKGRFIIAKTAPIPSQA